MRERRKARKEEETYDNLCLLISVMRIAERKWKGYL
jgi:hypothetical protein